MKYMLLLVGDESVWANASEAERQRIYEMHGKLAQALERKGAFIAGAELGSAATATTVRNENGRALITDGPFAETTEHLGGFYLIEAADLDEALGYARMLPGTVEVRPVVSGS